MKALSPKAGDDARAEAGRLVEISVRHPRLKTDKLMLRQVILALDAARERFDGGCPPGELSIALVGDREQADLHGRFLDDPSATDVITFEGEALAGLAGEICVSADTAARFAKLHGKVFSEELTLYVAHGWLHLAGYDDLRPEWKRRMRRAEARAMKLLSKAGLLRSFAWKPGR
jgi:probable rRNA maturation factor